MKEIIDALKSAIIDFKNGDYTILPKPENRKYHVFWRDISRMYEHEVIKGTGNRDIMKKIASKKGTPFLIITDAEWKVIRNNSKKKYSVINTIRYTFKKYKRKKLNKKVIKK